MDVVTEEDRKQRKRDFDDIDKERAEKDKAKKRQNTHFIQVYPLGWDRIDSLMKERTLAARIYVFLAKHIDEKTGSVVVGQDLLAEELGVCRRSIIRATAWLHDNNIVPRIKLGGSSTYAYCLNPNEVWKSINDDKKYAAFRTKTLARKSDNGDIKRKLKCMLKGKRQAGEPNTEDDTPEDDTGQ